MGEKELRKSMAVFPIGTVIRLTGLTARQIRYYEEQELVFPKRSEGNRRLFSLNDVDRLLDIHDFLKDRFTMADIRQYYALEKEKQQKKEQEMTDRQVRRLFQDELLSESGLSNPTMNPQNLR